jgi:hypothetical protein
MEGLFVINITGCLRVVCEENIKSRILGITIVNIRGNFGGVCTKVLRQSKVKVR